MSDRKYYNLMSERITPFSIDHPPSSHRSNSPLHRFHGKLQRLTLNGLSSLSYRGRSPNNRRKSPEKKLLTPEILSSLTLSSPWKGIPRNYSKERNGQKFSFSRPISTTDDLMSSCTSLKQLNNEQFEQSRKSTTESTKEFSLLRMEEYPIQIYNDVDFTKPDPSRPLEIKCGNRSIFIDPEWAQDVSPFLTNFFVRELVAGKRRCVEIQRDDISFQELLTMVEVICPTELGMFPKSVDSYNFLPLAKLSKKFNVTKLKSACELFISRMPLDDPKITTEDLSMYFVASYQYGLSRTTKIRLLEAIVGREVKSVDANTLQVKGLSELIQAAIRAYHHNELNHSDLTNEIRLRVPCRTCRMEQPNVPLQAVKGELSTTGIPAFVVCSKCKSTICCACVLKPCQKALNDFSMKFCETYNSSS